MRKVGVVLGGMLLGMSLATPILAASTAGASTTGQIEICKVASSTTPLPVTGTFSFTVTGAADGVNPVLVPVGTCSMPIPVTVTGTTTTITENNFTPAFAVSAITQISSGVSEIVGTPNLTAGSVTVNVVSNLTTTIQYTNTVVPGFIEVCKTTTKGDTLTGSYGFNLTGLDSFSSTVSVPLNECSAPVEVPAGPVTVQEAGTNLNVTGITAGFNSLTTPIGATSPIVTQPNLGNGTVTVTVQPSKDTSLQTDVNYTNDTVGLKVCKTFTGTLPTGVTSFPFSFAVSGAPGPAGPTSAVNIAPATCQIVGYYRPGTLVTVTEGIVTGTKVNSIGVTGAFSFNPTPVVNPDPLNGTVSVLIGSPSSPTTGLPGNEAVVTYNDVPAQTGVLKLCKTFVGPIAGALETAGSVPFSLTVGSATPVTVSIQVPAQQASATASTTNCVIVGNFPFNTKIAISEPVVAGNALTGLSVSPAFVQELVGGTLTATAEPVQAVAASLTAQTVTVVIGETSVTEVTYTDIDPPVAIVGGGTVVSNPGINAGTTIGANPTIASSIAAGISTAVGQAQTSVTSPAITAAAGVTSLAPSTVKALTASQRKALLSKDEKTLTNVKATITKFTKVLAHSKGAAHRAAAKRLASLKAEKNVLNLEIALLKK
jgi:hypothetical protein